jgi:hypothetical protein
VRETPKGWEISILGVRETPKDWEISILGVRETPKKSRISNLRSHGQRLRNKNLKS